MADKTWKAVERKIAKYIGGERRGADFRDESGGKNDIIFEGFSPECKHSSRPTFGLMESAFDQAKAAAAPDEIPFAVIHKKGKRIPDSLVVMRLSDFREWFIK